MVTQRLEIAGVHLYPNCTPNVDPVPASGPCASEPTTCPSLTVVPDAAFILRHQPGVCTLQLAKGKVQNVHVAECECTTRRQGMRCNGPCANTSACHQLDPDIQFGLQ